MPSSREEKRVYWASHVKEWKASGETQSCYCRRHRLKAHQLSYWKQVLESNSSTEHTPTYSGFVAVQVADPHPQGLTIRLPNGLCLEGVHAENLAVARDLIGWLS